ncbi:MAG: PA2169 family four-helix-bundle protein [Flavobacterium sp.]|nr:PA2169 family four-helix-bundle protein [Flavobacterium sp.]
MDNEKTIDALNSLIVINNDRIEGYKTAEAEAKETDLKMLFSDLMETSINNRKELIEEIAILDGTIEEGTRITGKFFRVWMDLKVAFTGNDRKIILESCEYGEKVALDQYEKVLRDDNQRDNIKIIDLLIKQQELLKFDYAKIVRMLSLVTP